MSRFHHALRLTLLSLAFSAGAQAAEPACPSSDLKSFVQAFATSPELQKAFSASPLVEQRPAYDDRGRSVTVRKKLAALPEGALALLDPQAQARAGLQSFWVDEQTLVVHDQLGDVLQAFVFKQNSCWNLARIEQWSVESMLNERAPANETALQRKLRKGSLYEGFGAREQYLLTPYFFELAQRIDLDAAAQGSAEGAVRAVVLGYSGMSPAVPPAQIEQLTSTYAEVNADAAMLLSGFYCHGGDDVSDEPCKDPGKAESTLQQAAKRFDSGQVYSVLGSAYADGTWGAKDEPRALACYQLAADKGDEEVLHTLAYYAKQGLTPPPGTHCL
jgi:TPR repeat protein